MLPPKQLAIDQLRRAAIKFAGTDPTESRNCSDIADLLAFDVGAEHLAAGHVDTSTGTTDFAELFSDFNPLDLNPHAHIGNGQPAGGRGPEEGNRRRVRLSHGVDDIFLSA